MAPCPAGYRVRCTRSTSASADVLGDAFIHQAGGVDWPRAARSDSASACASGARPADTARSRDHQFGFASTAASCAKVLTTPPLGL